MTIQPTSLAALNLLRQLADRLEKGEVIVTSLTSNVIIPDNTSDPYWTLAVRNRLEVVVCNAPSKKEGQ